MASRRQNVLDILRAVSQQTGVPFGVFNTFGAIESGFRPNARTGSYKGVFQLSNKEFNKHGGGNIYDAEDNARAFANLVKENAKYFKEEVGRNPTTFDLYMMHQQGTAGYLEHISNPDRPAWQSMYATGEGKRKGTGWAKKAIWGNLPPNAKRQYGSVANVTSKDFLNTWKARVERLGGGNPMNAVAEEAGVSPPLPGRRVSLSRGADILSEDASRGISRKSAGYASGATFPRIEDATTARGGSGGGREAPTVSETIQAPLTRQVSSQNGARDEARLPIPFPSSRRESLGSQKGYGRLPDTFTPIPETTTATSSSGPTRVSAPVAPSSSIGPGNQYDFPWPGTAPLTWAGEGLKPGSAIPTTTPANASVGAQAGVNALGVKPPLFRDFFLSIFGGGF